MLCGNINKRIFLKDVFFPQRRYRLQSDSSIKLEIHFCQTLNMNTGDEDQPFSKVWRKIKIWIKNKANIFFRWQILSGQVNFLKQLCYTVNHFSLATPIELDLCSERGGHVYHWPKFFPVRLILTKYMLTQWKLSVVWWSRKRVEINILLQSMFNTKSL